MSQVKVMTGWAPSESSLLVDGHLLSLSSLGLLYKSVSKFPLFIRTPVKLDYSPP